jgi:hypothetical protein
MDHPRSLGLSRSTSRGPAQRPCPSYASSILPGISSHLHSGNWWWIAFPPFTCRQTFCRYSPRSSHPGLPLRGFVACTMSWLTLVLPGTGKKGKEKEKAFHGFEMRIKENARPCARRVLYRWHADGILAIVHPVGRATVTVSQGA